MPDSNTLRETQPCISPDGTHVIWAKKDGGGRVSAWVRRIE